MRRALLVAVLLSLPALSAFGDSGPAGTVRRFFEAYVAGQTLEPFWSDGAKGRQAFERAAKLTHRSRCLELHTIRVDLTHADAEAATARVTMLLSKRERPDGRAWGPEEIAYEVALRRSEEVWRISDIASSAERLAGRLLSAGDKWRDLLTAESMSPALGRALIREGIAATNVPDLATVSRVAAMVEEIALRSSDRGALSLQRSLLSTIARMERRTGAARALGEESVAIAREVGDADVLARALVVFGRAESEAGKGESAMGLFREAAALKERVEDLSLIVRALTNLSGAASISDDFVGFRRNLDEQLALAEAADDTTGKAAALHNLSTLYEDLRDWPACIEYAKRAADLWSKISPGEIWIAATLNEAKCRAKHGDEHGAREGIDRAMTAAREWKNDRQLSWAHCERAILQLDRREYDAAERSAREALRIFRFENPFFVLAPALLGQHRYAEALAAMDEYRRDFNLRHAPFELAVSLLEARGHRGLGDVRTALEKLRAALGHSEKLLEYVPGDAGQRAMAGSAHAHVFAEAIDLHVELGRTAEAFQLSERARGSVLLDTLRRGQPRPAKEMTAEERERELRLESEIATLNRALAETKGGEAAAIRERLQSVRVEYTSFQTALYARHPRLQVQRGDVAVASLREMATALPEDAAFVEYSVGEERTHAFVVARSADGTPELHVRTLPVARRDLEARVIAYRAQVAARGAGVRAHARGLDAILLEPLEELLGPRTVIGIVPDGVLWQLPFDSLRDRRGRYRLERLTIFYSPSVSVLLEMQKGRARPGRGRVLAVGDPLISVATRNHLTAVYRSAALSPLPEARLEAEKLGSIYGRDAAVYVGAEATEPRVRAGIRDYGVLHFATHGILDDSAPMYSRLLLAEGSDPTRTDNDGLLETWELMKLDIDADLMVMSSCDSARGRVTAGEGLIGLTWAAFVAGARTTVASLWKVASKSTATLMVDFHGQLHVRPAGPIAKAEALRRAKLRMLRDARHRHPFYWAPFVLIGNPGAQ